MTATPTVASGCGRMTESQWIPAAFDSFQYSGKRMTTTSGTGLPMHKLDREVGTPEWASQLDVPQEREIILCD